MSTATENPPEITVERAYEILCNLLKKKKEGHPKVMAHLRAVTGKSIALPVYHNEKSIPDEQKHALYTACVRAVLHDDYTQLQGQGKELSQTGETKEPLPVERKEAQTATTQTAPPESTMAVTITQPPDHVKPGETRIVDALLAALLPPIMEAVDKRLLGCSNLAAESVMAKLKNGGFPEERVRTIVMETIKSRFSC